MPKEIRAVAYARVSSKEQAEKELSIPAQLDAIRNYCKQKGYRLVYEYIDAGKSAKTDDRPEFQKMIAMAKKHNKNFEVIVVHKFDRFSRNRDDHVIYKSLLKKVGVIVYSVSEPSDPESPVGFLMEGILEVISEFYNLNLRNEVFKGMTENAKRGFHNGGIAPYGYKLSKVSEASGAIKTILVPSSEEEISVVKRIFNNYVYEGHGYKQIASDLNLDGIASPSGGQWSYTSIYSILHNEAYIGNRIWNMYDYSSGKKKKDKDKWVKQVNTHTAIISKEVFDLVQEKSKGRIKNSNLFEATNTSFILRGLFKCPYCGNNMVGSQSGSRNGDKYVRRYYVCGVYQRKGKAACKFKSFNKEKLEKLVINALLKEFTLLNMDGVLEEEISKYYNDKNKEKSFKLSSITKEIELTQMRIEMLKKDLNILGDKSKINDYLNELKTQLQQHLKSKEDLESSIALTTIDKEVLSIVKNKLSNFINIILSQSPQNQNMLLKEFIDSINYNIINDIVTINITIKSPGSSDVIFEKQVYVSF